MIVSNYSNISVVGQRELVSYCLEHDWIRSNQLKARGVAGLYNKKMGGSSGRLDEVVEVKGGSRDCYLIFGVMVPHTLRCLCPN